MLNVDTNALRGVSATYAQLADRLRAVSPQALTEFQAIAASHGKIGYPFVVGLGIGLTALTEGVESQAARFDQYAQRFNEHATGFEQTDHALAGNYDSPEGIIAPPRPEEDGIDFEAVVCWIATSDGDTSACRHDTTEHMYVEDGAWKVRQIDNGMVTELPDGGPGHHLLPEPPPPGTDVRRRSPRHQCHLLA